VKIQRASGKGRSGIAEKAQALVNGVA